MNSPAAPHGSAGEHTSAVEKAVDQIRHNVKVIGEKIVKLMEHTNSAWLSFSPAVKHALIAAIREAQKAIDRVLKVAAEVLAHYAPVFSLINISFHWLHGVKGPVSNLAQDVSGFANRNLAQWEGGSAIYYKEDVVPPQRAAVEATAAKAGFISEWLSGIAQANVDFVTELSNIIAVLAGQFAQAAVDAAGVVTIPWAIDTLAGSVGEIVEQQMSILLGYVKRIVAAGENARKVLSEHVDLSVFKNEAWPQAVRG